MSNPAPQPPMSVLVIGAYGLIGSGIVQRLARDGHRLIGLGRDIATAQRVVPTIDWRAADLRDLTQAAPWRPYLDGIDAVVNCSGALQDGPQDSLEAVHHHAIAALAQACAAADIKLVQISATGADAAAATPFLASKGRGDLAIQAAGGQHHIFRPGLVLARHGYGGTTMLRMLAAVPYVQPLAIADAKIQTIALDDLADAVSAALAGRIPAGFVGDLVETDTHSMREVVVAMRAWLGTAPATLTITLPDALLRPMVKIADGLGRLGWRSPLRQTAVTVLADGVTGRPTDVTQYGLPPIKSLSETLADMPARVEDRMFARMALLTPLIIATLVVFWAVSGLMGIVRVNAAAQVLVDVGWPQALAITSVLFWAFVDIAIAAALAYRPTAKIACWAAVGVSLVYLVASTVFVPSLWVDPLGPLVKVLPSIALALVARVTLDTR